MSVQELKTMKTQLMNCVQNELGHIEKIDTHELGQAIDMIKDLSQAIYYCTITDAMEKTSKDESKQINNINYYTTMPEQSRRMDRNNGYMYYPGNDYMYYTPGGSGSQNMPNASGMNRTGSNVAYYTEMLRDPREGRAAIRRRMYMEGKEQHKDPSSQMRELEAYLQELSGDIAEMIRDASPEERATLHQQMTTLANKIA